MITCRVLGGQAQGRQRRDGRDGVHCGAGRVRAGLRSGRETGSAQDSTASDAGAHLCAPDAQQAPVRPSPECSPRPRHPKIHATSAGVSEETRTAPASGGGRVQSVAAAPAEADAQLLPPGPLRGRWHPDACPVRLEHAPEVYALVGSAASHRVSVVAAPTRAGRAQAVAMRAAKNTCSPLDCASWRTLRCAALWTLCVQAVP